MNPTLHRWEAAGLPHPGLARDAVTSDADVECLISAALDALDAVRARLDAANVEAVHQRNVAELLRARVRRARAIASDAAEDSIAIPKRGLPNVDLAAALGRAHAALDLILETLTVNP